MNKICSGDEVIVLTGKDKSRRGVVLSRSDVNHLVVDGVNVVKRHTKPNPMKNIVGGIVAKSMPIHQSNLAIFNPATGRADRVGIKVLPDGKKVRIYRSSGEEIGSGFHSKKAV